MAGNTFGTIFRITTFGESHGGAVGVVVDGCPPGLELTEADIQVELDRRKPGQSNITTQRAETDTIKIYSGVFQGKTTGTPIMLMAMNVDQRPEDYIKMKDIYRPGHADYTYDMKYGFRDWCGGGRASARETLARVAAGAIAKKYLAQKYNIQILSYVEQVGSIAAEVDHENVGQADIEANIIRCPDQGIAKLMIDRVEEVLSQGDSIGGIIKGVIKNVPAGLGEPVFDKISADLGKAMLSINATKGFEIGLGFKAVSLLGSENNDEFYIDSNGAVKTRTNNAGGTLGGISSGQTIYFRVAFKPVSTIRKAQRTITVDYKETELAASGRHDPCVLPRAVPVVDAMAALVVLDHLLRNKAQNG